MRKEFLLLPPARQGAGEIASPVEIKSGICGAFGLDFCQSFRWRHKSLLPNCDAPEDPRGRHECGLNPSVEGRADKDLSTFLSLLAGGVKHSYGDHQGPDEACR